jgi:acetylornithine deacetylase/succinyl-diaminopimelate desuccinylase-like protein
VIEDDVRALAGMVRDSAGAGERGAAVWVRERLLASGVEDVALEPYRWPRTYAWSHLLHAVAGLSRRRLVRLAAAVSYELEVSGRLQWTAKVLPKGNGLNVVARLPADGRVERTLVLVAHLDAQRSGLVWDRRVIEAGVKQRLKTRRMAPAAFAGAVAIALGFKPLSLLHAALLVDTASRPTVPGANDNASGVAALLEVARRLSGDPLPGTEVLLVFPGSEESGMGGMRQALADHPLDPERSFVLGLDTVGSGTPVLAGAEGGVLTHDYADADLQLVERGAAAAGVEPPERWRVGAWTDPILARFAGLRTASLLSVGEHGMYTHYHRMDDVPEHVDLACVARCAAIAEGTARVFAAS